MKRITITGNAGADPVVRYDNEGAMIVSFSVAVTTGSKPNQKTDWITVNCYGKDAVFANSYIKKGTKVLVDGSPSVTAYINDEGKPVGVQRISVGYLELLGKKDSSNEDKTTQGITNNDEANQENEQEAVQSEEEPI